MPPADPLAAAFDPTLPGICESDWRQHLARSRVWSPSTRRLLVVSPHPDDEILGAGGLMALCAGRGCAVAVVSVTDGEAAYPHAGDLGVRRRTELRAALQRLSPFPIEVIRLGLPDGRVAAHPGALRAALAALLDEEVTLVAPFEHDGHPDHETVGAVCRELAAARGVACVRYLIWRWHHGHPATLRDVSWGTVPLPAAVRRAKRSAVRCFASQVAPVDRAPILPPPVLAYFERPFEPFLL